MPDGSRTYIDPASGDTIIEDEVRTPPKVEFRHFDNLAAEVIPGTTLDTLASSVGELISWDAKEREGWEEALADNVALLGLGPESDPDDHEYENSDTSDSSLMLTALLRFQSKGYSAMLPLPDRICHTECALDLDEIPEEVDVEGLPEGEEPPQTREQVQKECDEAGHRVEKFIADYLGKRYLRYRPDTDRIIYDCGMHGLGIRKVWVDHSRHNMKVRVDHVPLQDLIFSYDGRRLTHRIDMPTPELIRNIQNGTFIATDGLASAALGEEGPLEEAENRIHGLSSALMREGESHRIYETRMDLFLENDPHPDGLARPYVVTVHAASQEILSIRRNWQDGDPDEMPIECYVTYTYHPGKDPSVGIGLGQILANTTRALRTAQRRGLEAAYLQNHPSGYKLSNMKIRDGSSKLRPGEFVDVDTPTGDIRAALMLHPFEGPSPGLLQIASEIKADGRELGGIAAIDFSQMMKAGIAAGPAMAAYDESTEFQTAIHSRLYHAHATELNLIMDRMREVYGNRTVPFGVNSVLYPGDLTLVNLTPIMQPGQISRQRKILEASAILEAAERLPDVLDRRRAAEDYIRALGKSNGDIYILPDPAEAPPPEPADPVTEYQKLLAGEPIAAGMAQNHQAHIDSHGAQMRLLSYSMLPPDRGETAMAALAAHISEHMGMQLLVEVAARSGIPIEQVQDPALEARIAPIIAEAIAAIEAERRPAEGQQESRVEVEMVKGRNQLTVKELEHRHAKELEALKAQHARALQRQRDEAEMERAIQDDESALEIASLENRNTAPTRAGGMSS